VRPSELTRQGRRRQGPLPLGSTDELYRDYQTGSGADPSPDERGLYEKLCLECLQSGLSWALILREARRDQGRLRRLLPGRGRSIRT